MIINFTLENFGPVRELQTISFEAKKYDDLENYFIVEPIPNLRLLKMVFLYGANASGKTTFLKGIEFLRDIVLEPLEKRNEEIEFKQFMFDENSRKANSFVEVSFVTSGKKYVYSLTFNNTYIVKESLFVYNPKKSVVFERVTDEIKQLSTIKFGSKLKVGKEVSNTLINNTLWNNTVLGGFLKVNVDIEEFKEVIYWFENTLRPMVTPRTDLESFVTRNINRKSIKKDNVVEILRKADLNIDNIKIEEKETEIPNGLFEFIEKNLKDDDEKKHISDLKEKGKLTSFNLEFIHLINGINYQLPFDDQSQGTQRFYGLAGILDLLVRKESVVPIDELESSLHPDLFIHFILMHLVNSNKSQIIATTHNREILKNRDIFRNDSVWFADKSDEGNTLIYALDEFDSKTIRDTSSIYNAYSIGKLGGVPELGDYYLDFKYDEDGDS